MNETNGEVWYLRTWGTFHLVVGIIFSVIFILGAIVINDYTFLLYLILSAGLIYMGINRLKKPYIEYSAQHITVRGVFGEIAKNYIIQKSDIIHVKNNSVFLNSKKMKFNHWFTNPHQYAKMIRLFSVENFPADELQD